MEKEILKDSKFFICSHEDFDIKDELFVGSPLLISQAVRVHLQNSRQGTVAVKSRSDLVSRSNKKPWKQKGTGRARAGSPRSPLWRGGGVCFGPQPRVRVLALPRKMYRGSMKYLFLTLLEDQKICRFSFDSDSKNTKLALSALQMAGIAQEQIILLYNVFDVNIYYSFSNLKNVLLVSYDAIHPYIFARDASVVFLEKDREQFQNVVNQWLV